MSSVQIFHTVFCAELNLRVNLGTFGLGAFLPSERQNWGFIYMKSQLIIDYSESL